MQPVIVIMKPVEIFERRRPRRLIVAQTTAIWMKVPLHCPGAYGQASAVSLSVTITHGVKYSIQMIDQAIYRIGGAGGSL
jgi:hypothetical protein